MKKIYYWLIALFMVLQVQAQTYTLGSGTGTTTTSGIVPFTTLYEDARIQYIYLASEMTAAGASAGYYSGIAFDFTTIGGPPPTNVNVKMGLTSASTLNALNTTTTMSTVYSAASVSPVLGWNTWSIAPFYWDGTSNILIEVCFDNSDWDGNYGVRVTNFASSERKTWGFYADGVAGCSITSGNVATDINRQNRPNLQITLQPPTPPVCATNHSPLDGATDAPLNTVLSWTASEGAASYDVFFGTVPNPALVSNQIGVSYNPGVLPANTTFYWKIVPKNIYGEPTDCIERTFTTGSTLQYCTSVPASFDGSGITNVTIGSTSIPNPAQSYTSHVASPVDVVRGSSPTFQVSFATGYTYDTNVWIDLNNDGDFTDAGELLGSATSLSDNPTTLSIPITIPGAASLGVHVMRIGSADDGQFTPTPCYSGSWGVTVDLAVNLIDPVNPPTCASNYSPANAATNIFLNQTLSWDAAGDYPASYDIYLGTSPSPSLVANVEGTTYVPDLLAPNTLYYWQVVPKNGNGSAADCPVNTFTTGLTPAYCIPATDYGCGDHDVIARVQLNTLDNNSGTLCPSDPTPDPTGDVPLVIYQEGPGYSDYTSDPLLTTTLQAGGVYSCTVWAGQWTEGYAVWIDYNDDGDFDDAGERVGYSAGLVAGSGVPNTLGASASFPIILACNPPVGQHRMRVRAMFNTTGINVTPCGANSFGEVEDYLITITEPDPCPVPHTLSATDTSPTGGTLTWVAGCAETAWEVVVQPVDSGVPAGSGVPVTETPSYVVSDLTPGVYEFYVRGNCEENGFSSWVGPLVFTPPGCANQTFPADDATGVPVSGGIITLTWDAVSGATSYNVMMGTTSGSLTQITNVTTLNVPITGFSYNTTYYWRIDAVGVGGTNTTCAEYSFTTQAPPANDICSGATDLATLTSPITASTTGLANDFDPSCNSTITFTSPDAYYSIVVPVGYTLSIGNTATSYDAVNTLAIGSCGSLTDVNCSDTDTLTMTYTNNTASPVTAYWIQDGWSSGSGLYTLAWSLTPPPVVVSSFSPASVCGTQGGATIVITGSNFVDVTSVQFNGIEADSFVVDSYTQISAVLPEGDTAGPITVYSTPSSNASGVSAEALIVNPYPVVDEISPAEAAVLCVGGETVQYSNTSPGGTWSTGNPLVATVDANGEVTAVGAGETNVIFTITLGTGCATSVTRSVIVNGPIVILDEPEGTAVVTDDPASFSVVATGSVSNAEWQVSTDGGFTFDPLTISPPYSTSYDSETNTYTLSISATQESMNGNYYRLFFDAADPCTDAESIAALLNVGDTGIQTQPVPVTMCSTGSGETQFSVVGSGPVDTYQWYVNWGFGPQPILGSVDELDGDVTYSGYDSGTLMISGLDTDNSGWYYSVDVIGPLNNVLSNEVLLTINEGASLTSQPEADQTCSSGGSTVFTVGYTGAVNGVQWQYSTSASGPFSNVANGTPAGFTYVAAGNQLTATNAAGSAVGTYYYRAVVDASAPCADLITDPAALSVTQPTIVVSPASASYCVPGDAVTLTASGAVSYVWSPATGLDATTGAVVHASPSATTTYTVTGTDASGCISTQTVTVTVGTAVNATINASATTICPGASVTLTAAGAPAGLAGYTFASTTGTYTPVSGGATALSTVRSDGGISATQNIPFSFVFNGVSYSSFRMEANGFMTFNTSAGGSNHTNNLSGAASSLRPLLAPLWDDLDGAGPASSFAGYEVTGTAPNRVLTVEWRNWEWNWLSSTPVISFQVKLFEGSNVIEYHYRSETAAYNSGSLGASIGMAAATGSGSGSFLSVSGFTSPTVSTTTETTNIETKPASGTIFRFTPPPTFTYQWSSVPEGFTSTLANPTVNPSETTTYNVVVTSSAGCVGTASVEIVVESGAEIVTQPVGSTICQGQALTLTVEATGPGLTYQWRRNGSNVGTNSPTYTVASATPANSGSYDVVITPACGAAVTSDAVSVTVNPTPTAVAPATLNICSGTPTAAIPLTGTPSGVTFNISGGAAIGLPDQTGVTEIPSFNPSYGSAVVSITPVANGCNGTTVNFSVNVSQTPAALSISTSSTDVCSNGDATLLTATGGTGIFNYAVGNGTTLNAATSTTNTAYPTPYGAYYENVRQQFLIRASELTAAGLTAGAPISSITFNVTTLGSSGVHTGYRIAIGNTAQTAIASFESGLTTVFGPVNYQPVSGLNTHTFSAPFVWNGTSNIMVEICHENDPANSGTVFTANAQVMYTTTGFNSSRTYRVDDTPACGNTGVTYTETQRPNMIFSVVGQGPVVWSPAAGLYTDAAATTPYVGGTSAMSVYAKPSTSATYSASVTTGGTSPCLVTSNSITVTTETAQDWYVDADGDGYGTGEIAYTGCAQEGYANNNTDCNDAVAAVNPGATEIAYNGIDDDCDGTIDEGSQVFSQVLPTQCGITLANIGSLVGLISVPAATAYRIEVTNTATNDVQVIERAVSNFAFTHLPVYDYAATYSIRVMVQRNGVWLNYYGNSCLVSTPAITDPTGAAQVTPSQCGITLATLNTLIATTSLANVAQYRFRVTDLTDGDGPNTVQIIDRPLHWFSLKMLTRYNYGTTYSIEVAVRTTGSSTFTGFGAPCNVTTPAVPQIAMCGQNIATAGTNVYTSSLDSVTSYRFVITNFNDFTVTTLDRPLHWFNFTMIPGYEPGATYGVAVAVMTSGEWSPFSDGCEIVAPGGARDNVKETLVPFNAVAYPNPFADTFSIELTTSAEANVNVKVYDMTGRMLEQKDVPVTDMATLQVGERYPAGVYNVIVTQGDQAKTLRVIKR